MHYIVICFCIHTYYVDYQQQPMSHDIMNKYKDRFLKYVDSHAIVARLQIDEVIPSRLAHAIKHHCSEEGTEELFLHFRENADPESINKLCDAMISKRGYANMIKLGEDMKKDLISKCVWVCVCVCVCVCV